MWLLLVLILTIVVCIFRYFHNSFSYWKRKNIPFFKPSIPLGSINYTFPKHGHEQINRFYEYFKSQGLKYGGVYFGTMPVFMPIDPHLIKLILAKNFDYFSDRSIYYDEEVDPLSVNLSSLRGDEWRSMKYILSPAFTAAKIRTMIPAMVECGKNMEMILNKCASESEVIDTRELSASYTTDVIGTCAFGIECNSILNPNNEFRKHGRLFYDNTFIDKIKVSLGLIAPSVLKFFKIPFLKPVVTKYIRNLVKETVEHREKHKITKMDFMDILIRIKNKENIRENDEENDAEHDVNTDLSYDQIAAQVFFFFVAGFETASTTMAFCLYELAQNQEIQNRLRDEINEVATKHNGNLTYEAIREMKYLDNVFNETMRKYSSVFMINRTCTKDFVSDEYNLSIAKGTVVIVPACGLHWDDQYFPNPHKFNPDRFEATLESFTYLPFGDGPRICIGMRFGVMQTKIGILSMIKNYKLTINEKTKIPIKLVTNLVILTTDNKIYLNVEKV